MTRVEFFKLLADTPRQWTVDGAGWLRCAKGDCPITAVYRKAKRRSIKPWFYADAAEKLGLHEAVAEEIACAADAHGRDRMRARLLRACGVKAAR